MTDLTQVTAVTIDDVATLYRLQEQLAEVKAAEAMLRRRVFDHFFPNPTEGSKDNKYPINDGTGAVLQADYKINRSVLEPELEAYKAAMKAEGTNAIKLPINKLVRYKPELVKSEYNKLTDEEKKACDTFLDVKPGMPEVKVVIPKRGA